MCSCSSTRADKLSAVSSSKIGTARCTTIAPLSTASSTKWTVHPATFAPNSSACACASSPGNAGSSDGCTFRIRFGNARTNGALRIRMYPARHTTSTRCWCSRAITSASCSARLRPADGTANAASPISRAACNPAASALFDSTTAICAPCKRCRRIASAIARKFDPRPESRIPSRFKPRSPASTALVSRLLRRRCRLHRRRRAGLRLHLIDRLVQQRNVRHMHPFPLRADDDRRRVLQSHPLAHRVVFFHFLHQLPRRIGHERHLHSMRLEEPPRKAQHVVLAGNACLRGKYRSTIVLRRLRRNLVLQIPRPHRRVEAPDVHSPQRKVPPHQRNIVMRRRRMNNRKRMGARRALQVLELDDRHPRPRRRLEHRRILERIPRSRRRSPLRKSGHSGKGQHRHNSSGDNQRAVGFRLGQTHSIHLTMLTNRALVCSPTSLPKPRYLDRGAAQWRAPAFRFCCCSFLFVIPQSSGGICFSFSCLSF